MSNTQNPGHLPVAQRYEFLDGLRGIAALLVVLFHFNNLLKEHSIEAFPRVIDWLIARGHCGVEIFFILSGFVISYSIRNQWISGQFALTFFLKRSIRLDPPYWIILCILIFLSLLGNFFKTVAHPVPGPNEIMINAFYLADLLQTPRILPVSWTLSLEIQFYLFLILFVRFLQFLNIRFSGKRFLFHMTFPSVLALSVLMILSLLQNTSFAVLPHCPGLFLPYWYSFFIGCLACWGMLNLISSSCFWIHWGMIGCFAGFAYPEAFETCFISAIIYLTAKKGKMHVYLASSLFQYLGKISYSLYLVHWVVGLKILDLSIRFMKPFFEHQGIVLFLFITALSLTFFCSAAFYHFIEFPCLKLSQKFFRSNLFCCKIPINYINSS